jgi:hypothetical protein
VGGEAEVGVSEEPEEFQRRVSSERDTVSTLEIK